MDIANNEEKDITVGAYAFDTTGALDLQWRPVSTFKTMSDTSFAGAVDGIIDLPTTTLKVINAGANVITLKKVG